MNIGSQIKKYREQLKISQEELADKVFVSRQTISNWENNKNYPDIKSLSLLSYIFNVSIDDFIKGDIEKMKEIINKEEIQKFNYYGKIYTIHLIVLILSVVPLFMWLERYALIPFGIFYAITMLWALKVEKLKKDNNIQTYKEIVAICGLMFYNELPESIAIHWGIDNNPNGYFSKPAFIFGLPIMMLALQVFCCIVSDYIIQFNYLSICIFKK